MKKVFRLPVLILLLISGSNIFADYNTPGTSVSWNLNDLVTNSGGTVTFSGGIYFINSNLTVSSSDTIKILSNATVKLALNVVFKIRGVIIASPPDSIKITSIDTAQKFSEMRIDTSSSSILQKVIYEYSFNGLRISDCSPLINQCTIRNNCFGNSATTAPAINLFRSDAVISNCLIFHNYKVAIGGGANIANAPQILFNLIIENNYANANASQINLGQSGTGTTVIRGNTIRGLYTNSGGIAALPIGTFNVIIENNNIRKNRYGIALNGSVNAIIRGNIIDSNNIQGSPNLGGSGLNFVGSGITAKVSKNIIRWNLWGVTLQSNAAPIFGDLSISDTNFVGMNQIHSNSNSGIFYDFYNNTPNPIKAENNFWGTMNQDSVEAHIFHQPDSSAFGMVDYLPLWAPVGVTELNTGIPEEFMLYDAFPNPFNPVTTIRFDITNNSDVKLFVYDITGKQTAILLDQNLNPGKYSVNFSAANLASGIYFYRLQTNEFTAAKKLILVK